MERRSQSCIETRLVLHKIFIRINPLVAQPCSVCIKLIQRFIASIIRLSTSRPEGGAGDEGLKPHQLLRFTIALIKLFDVIGVIRKTDKALGTTVIAAHIQHQNAIHKHPDVIVTGEVEIVFRVRRVHRERNVHAHTEAVVFGTIRGTIIVKREKAGSIVVIVSDSCACVGIIRHRGGFAICVHTNVIFAGSTVENIPGNAVFLLHLTEGEIKVVVDRRHIGILLQPAVKVKIRHDRTVARHELTIAVQRIADNAHRHRVVFIEGSVKVVVEKIVRRLVAGICGICILLGHQKILKALKSFGTIRVKRTEIQRELKLGVSLLIRIGGVHDMVPLDCFIEIIKILISLTILNR